LSFTDGVALANDRILFSAAAEATDDPYLDGACAGSVVGFCSRDGQLDELLLLQPALKVEGVHAVPADSGALDILLVTDADDRAQPAQLRHARLESRPTRRLS
jgi:hypothetical protein